MLPKLSRWAPCRAAVSLLRRLSTVTLRLLGGGESSAALNRDSSRSGGTTGRLGALTAAPVSGPAATAWLGWAGVMALSRSELTELERVISVAASDGCDMDAESASMWSPFTLFSASGDEGIPMMLASCTHMHASHTTPRLKHAHVHTRLRILHPPQSECTDTCFIAVGSTDSGTVSANCRCDGSDQCEQHVWICSRTYRRRPASWSSTDMLGNAQTTSGVKGLPRPCENSTPEVPGLIRQNHVTQLPGWHTPCLGALSRFWLQHAYKGSATALQPLHET